MYIMKSAIISILIFGVLAHAKTCKKTNAKLFCYYSKSVDIDACRCSHVILPSSIAKDNLDRIKGPKILLTLNDFNQDSVELLKSDRIDGIELALKNIDTKEDINDFLSTLKTKLNRNLYVAISVPGQTELLAKYYDFKGLAKKADAFILQTAFLGASKNVTFHPSRLSGLWDMQNIDSMVDLVNGLGAPLSKLVITSPVQAFRFKLQSEKHTAPGSPALELKTLTRDELCNLMKNGVNWTLERDQDQTGPYIFSKNQWIAFEDSTSMDIKAKYTRVRGLAGLALKDLAQDGGTKCETTILETAHTGLSRQSRAPRGAVLHSLEREILESPARPLDSVQVSPYRISRIVDTEGKVHVVRQDTRTEFECSRQGYFVHPRSCNRFYRCVKFDQLSDEFSVFEFDCPAGLAFDERVEVCVWPGSLPNASPCAGSSEIAPVPRQRFICPSEPGYYADPENCRWFFACLDHGKSPLSAYEFRCPFGLVYDESRLLCEWPWLVARCASGNLHVHSQQVYGGPAGPVLVLEQYNGLGALGPVVLGGLTGQLPVAPVVAGLSYKATQSLQNAGLLQGGQVYTQGGLISGLGQSGQSHGLDQVQLVGGIGLGQEINTGLNYNDNGDIRGGGLTGGQEGLVYTGGKTATYNTNAQLINTLDGLGVKSGVDQGVVIGGNLAFQNQNAKSEQNFIQYHDQGKSVIDQNAGVVDIVQDKSVGTQGNINIIGAGYSAVGVASDGVEVINNGESINVLSQVSPSPISVATIPTVTSVPLPSIKSANAFESLKGGVVANIPQLQLKVQKIDNNLLHHSQYNSSANIGSFVSTTPATIGGGFVYSQPAVNLIGNQEIKQVQGFISSTPAPILLEQKIPLQPVTLQKTNIENEGYIYEKPSVKFEQTNAQVSLDNNYNYQKIDVAQKAEGYVYDKPSVAFQEVPITVTSTVRPVELVQPVVQQQAVSYSNFQKHDQISSQHYKRPDVVVTSYNVPSTTIAPIIVQEPQVLVSSTPAPILEQKIVQPLQPAVASYNYQVTNLQNAVQTEDKGYDYPKPVVQFEQKPVVLQQAQIATINNYQQHDTAKTFSAKLGYSYQKPAIKFEEKPIVVQPTVTSFATQNIVVDQQKGYEYSKPSVVFEEKPIAVQPAVSTYNYQQQHVQTNLNYESKPAVYQTYTYHQPAVQQQTIVQQPLVSTYTYQAPVQKQPVTTYSYQNVAQKAVGVEGYTYNKPAIRFEEVARQPAIVSSYSYTAPSTVKPVTLVEQPVVYTTPKPAIVSSYSYTASPTPKPTVLVEQPVIYSTTPQPVIIQKQPAVISSYSYSAPSTVKPAVIVEQPKQPVVVSSYSYTAPSTPKPLLVEQPAYVETSTIKPAVISSYSYQKSEGGYQYPNPSVGLVEEPAPIVTTYQEPVREEPFVAKKAYVTGQTAGYQYTQQFGGYNYDKPSIQFEEKPIVVENYQQPQPAIAIQAQQKYSQATDTSSAYYVNYNNAKVVTSTPAYEEVVSNTPVYRYNIVQSTPKPSFSTVINDVVTAKARPIIQTYSTPIPVVQTVSTSRPIVRYSFGSLDNQYSSTPAPIEVPEPTREYLPANEPVKEYLPAVQVTTAKPYIQTYSTPISTLETVTTSRPIVRYSFGVQEATTSSIEIPPPPKEYLPIKVTTEVPQSTYLEPEIVVTTKRPAKIVKIVRPKTFVKENDFHPLLAAKLGAQCTCVSNTIKLRKNQERIIVDEPVYDEGDDGYIVDNGGTVVENYAYEPQKTVAITPIPEVYVSSTSDLLEVSTPRPRGRARVVIAADDEDKPTDKEIAKAVRTGLKLVKQAAKEGAEEAIESKDFDRYGPGGVRSRTERLQGTIDCQRAGLFRHPTQCNKFYSCVWDCKKERYTLHVFNCPIHLTFDKSIGACNWPSQGPACLENTLLPSD